MEFTIVRNNRVEFTEKMEIVGKRELTIKIIYLSFHSVTHMSKISVDQKFNKNNWLYRDLQISSIEFY